MKASGVLYEIPKGRAGQIKPSKSLERRTAIDHHKGRGICRQVHGRSARVLVAASVAAVAPAVAAAAAAAATAAAALSCQGTMAVTKEPGIKGVCHLIVVGQAALALTKLIEAQYVARPAVDVLALSDHSPAWHKHTKSVLETDAKTPHQVPRRR